MDADAVAASGWRAGKAGGGQQNVKIARSWHSLSGNAIS